MVPRFLLLGTAVVLITGCGQDLAVDIPFTATWQGEPLTCNSERPALTDLRLYVNNLKFIDTEGVAHDVRYATEYAWENDAVALIDLEDGTGACENGTAETFDRLIGAVPQREYRGLRFTVGVPFRLNHANPLTAKPPLDDSAMHWHWRSGYKFLRAGVRTGTDGFWIHVGSAGCEGTVGHVTACKFPNRIQVDLPDFVRLDIREGVSRTTQAGPEQRETRFVSVERSDGVIVMHGAQAGRAFSWLIVESSGEGTLTIGAPGQGITVFTGCTPD